MHHNKSFFFFFLGTGRQSVPDFSWNESTEWQDDASEQECSRKSHLENSSRDQESKQTLQSSFLKNAKAEAEGHFMRHENFCHFNDQSPRTCCSRLVESDLWIPMRESLRLMDDGRCCDSMNLCLARDLDHVAAFRPILMLSNSTQGER